MSALVRSVDNEGCLACPGKDALMSISENALAMDKIEDIHVEHWIAGVRSPEENIFSPAEFSENFLDAGEDLMVCHFMSKQQAKYL